MSKLVYDQAQIALDDFYQTYRVEDDFFDLSDFALRIIDERDNSLNEEFTVQWRIAQQKNQSVQPFILVNPMWCKRVTLDIKHDDERDTYYAEICEPVYEFPFDQMGLGIQDVAPFGSDCGMFVRILASQIWQPCMVSSYPIVFYAIENCQINLYNFNGYCTKKLDVTIVPSQSALPINQQTVPDGKAAEIREKVLSKMLRDYMAKKGQIKVTNDGNPNPEPNESGLNYTGLATK